MEERIIKSDWSWVNPGSGVKKMFNLNENNKKCALSNKELCFWQCKQSENGVCLFLTRGIYSSLTFGTAKFKPD